MGLGEVEDTDVSGDHVEGDAAAGEENEEGDAGPVIAAGGEGHLKEVLPEAEEK